MAARAEPRRGPCGSRAGPQGRRRRPGPPPAPPTLAQRAAAASPLRMSRKGPRAEVCADCSAPGKRRDRAGGGTAPKAAAGRAPRPGGSAVRGRRAGRGPLRSGVLGGRASCGGRCTLEPVDLGEPPPTSISASRRKPGVAGGPWRRPAGCGRWALVWFVSSLPPPRLAPAAHMFRVPAGAVEGKGPGYGLLPDRGSYSRTPSPCFPSLGLLRGPGVQEQSKHGHLPRKHLQACWCLGTSRLSFSCSG